MNSEFHVENKTTDDDVDFLSGSEFDGFEISSEIGEGESPRSCSPDAPDVVVYIPSQRSRSNTNENSEIMCENPNEISTFPGYLDLTDIETLSEESFEGFQGDEINTNGPGMTLFLHDAGGNLGVIPVDLKSHEEPAFEGFIKEENSELAAKLEALKKCVIQTGCKLSPINSKGKQTNKSSKNQKNTKVDSSLQNEELFDSTCSSEEDIVIKTEQKATAPVTKVETDDFDFIGDHCQAVGCNVSWLESGLVKLVPLNCGMVYELDEFAKKIAWEKKFVGIWLLRLCGIDDVPPSDEDLGKIKSIIKRRKALCIISNCAPVKMKQKVQEFDAQEFVLPSVINSQNGLKKDLINLGFKPKSNNSNKSANLTDSKNENSSVSKSKELQTSSKSESIDKSVKNESKQFLNKNKNSESINIPEPSLNEAPEVKEKNVYQSTSVSNDKQSPPFKAKSEVYGLRNKLTPQIDKKKDLEKETSKTDIVPGVANEEVNVEQKSEITKPKGKTNKLKKKSAKQRKINNLQSKANEQKVQSNILENKSDKSVNTLTELEIKSDELANKSDKIENNSEEKDKESENIGDDAEAKSVEFENMSDESNSKSDESGELQIILDASEKESVKQDKLIKQTNQIIDKKDNAYNEFEESNISSKVINQKKNDELNSNIEEKDLKASDIMDKMVNINENSNVDDDTNALDNSMEKVSKRGRICKPSQKAMGSEYISTLPVKSDEKQISSPSNNIKSKEKLNKNVSHMELEQYNEPIESNEIEKTNSTHNKDDDTKDVCVIGKGCNKAKLGVKYLYSNEEFKGTITNGMIYELAKFYTESKIDKTHLMNKLKFWTGESINTKQGLSHILLLCKYIVSIGTNTSFYEEPFSFSNKKNYPENQTKQPKKQDQGPKISTNEDGLNLARYEILKDTLGDTGCITRGDVVLLYCQWLDLKKESNVFVSDLQKSVSDLFMERKIPLMHIPTGTLMSSSVKLYDEYKSHEKTNKNDAKIYLKEDWLEDIKYLVSVSKSSRRSEEGTGDSRNKSPGFPKIRFQNKKSEQNKRKLSESEDETLSNPPKKLNVCPSISQTKLNVGSSNSPKKIDKQPSKSPEKIDIPATSCPPKNDVAEVVQNDYEVEKLVSSRTIRLGSKTVREYKVRWVGFSPSEDSWINEVNLDCPDKVTEFWNIVEQNKKNKKQKKNLANRPPPPPKKEEETEIQAHTDKMEKQAPADNREKHVHADKTEKHVHADKTEQVHTDNIEKQVHTEKPFPFLGTKNKNGFYKTFTDSLSDNQINYGINPKIKDGSLTKGEVLAIYDEWRKENHANSSNVKLENLYTKLTPILAQHNISFDSKTLLNVCYRMSLTKSKITNPQILNFYLSSDFEEIFKASQEDLKSNNHRSVKKYDSMKGEDKSPKAKNRKPYVRKLERDIENLFYANELIQYAGECKNFSSSYHVRYKVKELEKLAKAERSNDEVNINMKKIRTGSEYSKLLDLGLDQEELEDAIKLINMGITEI